MQHAMMRTWDFWALHRIGNQPVGTEHFKAIGTMKEALHVHLEEIYADLKDPKSKIIAEKLFKALTDVTKESRGTRRPTQLSEICFLADAKEEEIIRIIDNFRKPGCAFLMPAASIAINADSIIDISHESIMRVWIRVRRWVEEESNSAQLYLRLSKSAELYQEGKTGLWVNPELQLALQWLSQNKPNATWAMRYDPAFDRAMTFLEYSKQQYEFELAKKENLQKRNLKRARNSAIILGVASLISILFLIISLNLRFKAEASRKEALEKEKLAVSESKRTVEQTKEAVLQKKISEQQQEIAEQQRMITEEQRKYAVKQQEIAQVQTSIAIDQKKKADESRQEAVESRDEAQSQRKVALTQKQIADQERIKAEESEKNTYRLRMLSVAQNLAITATQLSNTLKTDLPALLAVTAQKLNSDYGGDASNPDIYAALSAISSDQVVLRGHEDAVRALTLSTDGKTLYSCGDDNKLLIWYPENGHLVKINILLPKNASEPLRYLEISGDNQWLFAGNTSGALLVWKCSAMHEIPKVFHAHSSVINAIAADPSKDMFVTAGSDGKLLLWDYANGSFKSTKLDSVSGKINCTAFSADGNLAYGTGNGEVKIIAMKGQNRIPATLYRDTNPVTSITYGKDGKWLTAGFSNGSMMIWDMSQQKSHPREIIGQHMSGITAVAFTADGNTLASSGFDRTIKMADFPTDESSPVTIKRHDGWIYDIVFTPDGKRMISCSADKTIRIMSIFNSDMAAKLTKKLTRNMTVEEWKKMVGEDIPYFKARQDLP
jgi:WD40 repeat protein